MKRVSLRQAIIDAIDETDPEVGRYPNKLIKWAKYIEKEIGSARGYKMKSGLFIISGSYLTTPDDCYRVLAIIPGDFTDAADSYFEGKEYSSLLVDTRTEDVLIWMPADIEAINPLLWEEIGDQIHFPQNLDGTEVTVIYQFIETDINGDWLVNESHLPAMTAYIIYMVAKIFRWKMFKSDKLLRTGHQWTLESLEREYNIKIRHARALDGEESNLDKSQS